MGEYTIRKSFTLKLVSFLLLPLSVILIGISGCMLAYAAEYPEVKNKVSFYDSNNFTAMYRNEIYSSVQAANQLNQKQLDYDEEGTLIEGMGYYKDDCVSNQDGEYTIYYNDSSRDQKYKYLIINNEMKEAYTNIAQTGRSDTIEELKNIINTDVKYWSLVHDEIQTNIENLSTENITYDKSYEYLRKQMGNNDVYTSFDEKVLTNNDNISITKFAFDMVSKHYQSAYVILAISLIVFLVTGIYLILSTGHKKGVDNIALDWLDKLPLELMLCFAFLILGIEGALIAGSCASFIADIFLGIILFLISSYVFGLTTIYCLGSIIKRIKAKQFFKNSIVAKTGRWIKRTYKKIVNKIGENTNISMKVALYMIYFIVISGILIVLFFNFFGALALIAFWVWTYLKIIKKVNEFHKVKAAVKNIYEGNTDIDLKEEELTGILKEMAIYVNDIAGGFSNAIEESLKSERLKTELITNVSHDIKTPLTSIINYVDLLKKENIQNEKAKEYLEVLDNKSQRLKKLIEDLVEASKASSGNIKLIKEKLNVKELIKQVTGEFEDKFRAKELEIILDLPKEDIYITADNRYMYRVIENLYSNIAKYALAHSRVYVDVMKIENKIAIAIKNISNEQLNISTEELMQRFVRGDSSRNTEGSGLGLSIARSLTELQEGSFNIYLDGDLFKVVLEFMTTTPPNKQ